MEFLRLLVNLRTPFLDALFGAITYLGDETLFMIVAMVFFWCVEKRKGYFLLFTGFCGTLINQFLKMLFCVPRPWLIDPSFPIVENARAAATGYSFPSGHTQNITGTFGGIARFTGRRWLRACAIAVVLLVAFSRMYLGVHTPLDVGVSLVIGTALVLLLWPLFRRADERPGILTGLFAALLLGTLAFVLYAELAPLPANAIPAFSDHGVKNAYTRGSCLRMRSTRGSSASTRTRRLAASCSSASSASRSSWRCAPGSRRRCTRCLAATMRLTPSGIF